MSAPGPRRPTSAPVPRSGRQEWSPVGAGVVTLLLVGGVWIQEVADQLLYGGRLDWYGIQPRDPAALEHILSAPFLHAGFAHLIANTVPLGVLAFLAGLRGLWRFVFATALIVVLGGGLVWLFGRGGSVHLGASALIFGYLAYLIGVGWWERSVPAILAAALSLLLYGGALWGLLPGNPAVSWEAHLFGFVAGLTAAALLHRQRPARARRLRSG